MKKLMNIRSNNALAGFAFALASAIPGSAAVLHVPADYTTIQAAVDAAAASGDEIQISPGVYTNQVVITNKSLTLSGSPGAILRATPNMQQTLVPVAGPNAGDVALLGIFESTNVVVSGLTFEGERLEYNYPAGFDGIWFLAAGGSVEDCLITGFRGITPTVLDGSGIHTMNPNFFEVGPVNIQVRRSTFADNDFSIYLSGDIHWENESWQPELLNTTFAVDDNTVVGSEPGAPDVGIWIDAGAGGEVERNTVADFDDVGTVTSGKPRSVGILALDLYDFNHGTALKVLQTNLVEDNILTNDEIDIGMFRVNGSTIVNNSIEGTAQGYRPIGLWISGNNVTVASNRFSNMQTGIVLLGDDPEFGAYFGIASNAVLDANGFCNVATNYVFEPQATYDLQSTLTCPWPELDIRAIQLSWPYFYNGYSVQTAPALNGPWSTSDATTFLQDGRNTVVVPADSNQQFFRLTKP